MITEQKGGIAYSFDVDDVLIDRGGISRGLGLISGKLKPHRLPTYDVSNLPLIVREVIDLPLYGVFEKVSFEVHARRKVISGVKVELETITTEGIVVYGNTGRSNKKAWVEMTEQTLQDGEIADYFQNIFYAPDGVKTAVSKAVALQTLQTQYKQVAHFDDDPRTVAYLASLFPDIKLYLIEYGSTGLLFSRKEMAKFPNIHRIGVISKTGK